MSVQVQCELSFKKNLKETSSSLISAEASFDDNSNKEDLNVIKCKS